MTAYLRTISVCSLSDVSCLSSSQISDSEQLYWKELVAKCMTEYCSSECNKPDNKKLVWIVSRRTAQNLQANHFSVPGLPTIPEGSWDESERLIYMFFCFIHAAFCLTESTPLWWWHIDKMVIPEWQQTTGGLKMYDSEKSKPLIVIKVVEVPSKSWTGSVNG